jgi:hypothetical protein
MFPTDSQCLSDGQKLPYPLRSTKVTHSMTFLPGKGVCPSHPITRPLRHLQVVEHLEPGLFGGMPQSCDTFISHHLNEE